MKKFLAATLAATMSLGLVACGGSKKTDEPAKTTNATATSDMKVAMVTDYGDITDQSFNQTTYEASKEWSEENGVEFNYFKPATDADADREQSMEQAIEEGYNVIVLPGFAFAQAVVDVAPNYPDVKFIAIDVNQADLDEKNKGTFKSDNVYACVYEEDIPGFYAGYAAVALGYTKLGFLGGMAVPSVVRYGYGFVQGAELAAKEKGVDKVTINYAYGGLFRGDPDFTSRMDTWYGTDKTEVVFAAGGGIYTSVAEAAVKTGGKVIGVDVDQAPSIDKTYGDGITVTSAMKGLGPTVKLVLDGIKAGEWDSKFGGKSETLGVVSDDPAENFVTIADSTQWADGKFTEDDYKDLVKRIHSGDIKVDSSTEIDWDALSMEHVTVNFQGNFKS